MKRLLLIGMALTLGLTTKAQKLNGFELKGALIPVREILPGGPPRDGIASIDRPRFKHISGFKEFGNNSQVLGVYYNGVAKAYPINIMDWHEIVNDNFAGKPVAVTYCPLCGSGVAFNANVAQGKSTEFGVSGLLYNSDVLLYDRATESLWSQIMGKAVSGPLKGQELELILTKRMTLRAWRQLYPGTQVLTTETGYNRNYQQTPYGNYAFENRTYFPVAHTDDTYHKKEWVIGVENNGAFKAYSLKRLAKLPQQEMTDKIGGETFTITWDKKAEHVTVTNAQGQEITSIQMFWFAWVAFHPQTEVLE